MTRRELEQLYFINKEIRMWEHELERIREECAAKSKQLTGMPFANTNETSDPTADLAVKMTDVEMVVLGKKKELELQRAKAISYIYGISDSLMRQIVKYRCLDYMKWHEIADLVGYERTSCSKKYDNFMRELEEQNAENDSRN